MHVVHMGDMRNGYKILVEKPVREKTTQVFFLCNFFPFSPYTVFLSKNFFLMLFLRVKVSS
jgi:hypothetical protein